MVEGAKALTSEPLPPPAAIAEADERLNLALLATLFNSQHGLAGLSEDINGQLDQFAQWLESYKITVRSFTILSPCGGAPEHGDDHAWGVNGARCNRKCWGGGEGRKGCCGQICSLQTPPFS